MSFFVDVKGQIDPSNIRSSDDESDDDFTFIPMPQKYKPATVTSRSSKDKEYDLDDTYLDFGELPSKTLQSQPSKNLQLRSDSPKVSTCQELQSCEMVRRLADPDKALEKSVLQPGLEKLHSLPSYDEGRRLIARKRKEERAKSTGKNWYNMKAPELTEEMKNDLEILKMRSSLDPKHFYKKNDFKTLPKYFQVGRIVESAADFYHSRIPKKDRKKTLVDELLADAEFQKSTKKRYAEIIADQKKTHYKAHRQAKRLKKKH
ncbi:deoxynucleotidyltransferase terminal-interacting protein 2-like [Thrips palmi]|uniref:Deoxynucleotidyltransferase terminal-interacting protein 2-like n=1 Tax=Thrips palmi TaxID=161013 RepID=A0A6P8YCA2_THRPL|nr:deoxynucleotidyltransferase terminal-interacting protein 2-like [Thrips palmi]